MGGVFDTVTDIFTGGDKGPSGAVGYSSPYVGETDTNARAGVYGRLGAKRKLKKGKTGEGGEADYEYDMAGTTAPIDPAEAAAKYKGMGYMDTALGKMNNKSDFKETYNSAYDPKKNAYTATTYNFQSTPDKAYNEAIQSGSKDIARAGASNLAKLNETVGTRRPGLLMKGAEQSNRDIGENLASLSTSLRGQAAKEKSDLMSKQQMEQAAENLRAKTFGEGQEQFGAGEGYKGYLSKADLEKSKADEAYRRDTGYGDVASKYLSGEMAATESERAYKDKALDYLMSMFQNQAGVTNQSEAAGQAARDKSKDRSSAMFGDLLGAGAKVGAAALCLPKGTQIELDNGTKNVEDIQLGDHVKGGKVIAIGSRLRPANHQFFEHIFVNGSVVMSNGHPYHDSLVSMRVAEHDSMTTHDILTNSGYYFVNGIRLGSTL